MKAWKQENEEGKMKKLAVLFSVSLLAGCFGSEEPEFPDDSMVILNPCLDNSDCNDGNICTTDSCVLLACFHAWRTTSLYCPRLHCDNGQITEEVCNGIDDDCNDYVDENLDCSLPDLK